MKYNSKIVYLNNTIFISHYTLSHIIRDALSCMRATFIKCYNHILCCIIRNTFSHKCLSIVCMYTYNLSHIMTIFIYHYTSSYITEMFVYFYCLRSCI